MTRSNLHSKYGSYSIRNYQSGIYGAAIRHADYYIDAVPNHKYYVSTWLYTVSRDIANDGVLYVDLSVRYNGVNNWIPYGHQRTLNRWEQFSAIKVLDSTADPEFDFAIANYDRTTATQEGYADGVILIDLTATFGAGNEPSKEWCDNNIDYFDGTRTFTFQPLE